MNWDTQVKKESINQDILVSSSLKVRGDHKYED
jgi:hypothetical protein